MALIKCIECGTEVSDLAQTCPKCGAPVAPSVKAVQRATKTANKAKQRAEWKARPLWQKFLFYLAAIPLAIIFSGIAAYIGGDSKSKREPEPDAVRARWACQSYIRGHVDDPDSLEFIDQQAAPSLIQKDGSYRVTMTLRANNRFGAKILTQMRCKVVKQADGFEVVSAKQINN